MMNKDFVAIIISHGRPKNVYTWKTLRSQGYTGKIAILIDNTDKKHDEYVEEFGSAVHVFDKPAIAKTTDNGDNFNNLRTTTHARNAAFDLAESLGCRQFVVLDDDYTRFDFRFDNEGEYIAEGSKVQNLDVVFAAFCKFQDVPSVTSIAMAQGGDFIGGADGLFAKVVTLKRKCMNSFFCSTDKRFKFISRLNEDVNTYLTLGNRGHIFFTANHVSLNQKATQKTAGGMTEAYLDSGTYVKSFYSVMYQPSSAKVSMLNSSNARIHHRISWKHTVPQIVRESFKRN